MTRSYATRATDPRSPQLYEVYEYVGVVRVAEPLAARLPGAARRHAAGGAQVCCIRLSLCRLCAWREPRPFASGFRSAFGYVTTRLTVRTRGDYHDGNTLSEGIHT